MWAGAADQSHRAASGPRGAPKGTWTRLGADKLACDLLDNAVRRADEHDQPG